MNLEMGEIKNGTYFKQWREEMPPTAKKRWRRFWAGFTLLWLIGALYAPTVVAGIARLKPGWRWLMSLLMGGFAFLWGGLKGVGLIQETAQEPNLLWVVLALTLPGAFAGFLYIMDLPPNPLFNMQKMLAKFARSQGRLQAEEVARTLAIQRGVPYATVNEDKARTGRRRSKEVKVGLDFASGEGHVLVSGPTRSGKGLHLTDTLLTWPGPALVVDPKGEALERTAGFRSQFGPIYCLPGHQVNLAAYYGQLLDRDDIAELHAHLMRPWESRETIFAEKARSLFNAVGQYAQAKRLDPMRVLIDLGESDAEEALAGLETVPAAKRHVRVFTNGASPDAYRDDKFVTSAFGNFTTRLAPYQKHIDTIAPPDPDSHLVIDPDWARQNGTIYITYSLQDLKGVGGVVAAVIAAMLRHHMGAQALQNTKERLLVALDELPAIGLKNIADYLATCGGYGITLLLYVQSIAQLKELYGPDGTSAILSNCAHQVWYPPAEYETAAAMSRLYGMTMKANPVHSTSRGSRQHKDKEGQANTQTNHNQGSSWSWQERPELSPNQIMALPKDQVLVTTMAGAQRYVFLGQRLNPIPLFDRLPPASILRLPRPRYGERTYTTWGEPEAPLAETPPPVAKRPLTQPEAQKEVQVEHPEPDNQNAEDAPQPSAKGDEADSPGKEAF
ncbi:MAG: type IV secretory system conjugative DNA transfer family protein [Anaerolineaceae bacterium]|nr:type IV secretory system conjugative DNA transfer family protein [Anaerolineaceae bacterium]